MTDDLETIVRDALDNARANGYEDDLRLPPEDIASELFDRASSMERFFPTDENLAAVTVIVAAYQSEKGLRP